MMSRKSIRILVTLVLATAMLSAFRVEARAAGQGGRSLSVATIASRTPKPGVGPMNGEPDWPNGGPLPRKDGTYPTGGKNGATWALRVQWMIRIWLGNLPKRTF